MERILCVRELKWSGRVLQQKVLILRDGVEVEEWQDVPGLDLHRKAYPEQFWRELDWDRPNYVIAAELGYSPTYISNKRGSYGHRSTMSSRLSWEGVDWNQSNSQIARQLSRSLLVVARARLDRGLPSYVRSRENRGHNWKIDPEALAKVDWEWTTDAAIGKRLGVTRERIRQIRIDLQKPECRVKWHSTSAVLMKWLHDNREKVEGLHYHDVVRMMPNIVQHATKYNLLKKCGFNFIQGRSWKYGSTGEFSMNFQLPNKWLALVWGIAQHIPAQRRMAVNFGPAKWHGGGFSRYILDPEFETILRAEIEIARAKGINVDVGKIDAEIARQKQRVAEVANRMSGQQ